MRRVELPDGAGVGVGVGLGAGVGLAIVGVGLGPGSAPHGVAVAANGRGFGSTRAKSFRLLSVSVQPLFNRVSDLFDGGTGAGEPSEHVEVP